MTLHPPFEISARLMPSVRIGGAFISIHFAGVTSDGRARYQYYIDTPTFEHSARDLKSGVGGGSLQQGMESLMAFLGAAAESHECHGENGDLFPAAVVKWACEHSDEIALMRLELEETPELITN